MGVHVLLGDPDRVGLLFGLGREAVAVTLTLVGVGGLGGIAVHLVRTRIAARRASWRAAAERHRPPRVDLRAAVPDQRRPGERSTPPLVLPAAEPTDPALTQIVHQEPADPALTQLNQDRHDGGGMGPRG